MSSPSTAVPELTVRAGRYRPGHVMPPHVDQTSRLSVVVAGRVRESVGGEDEYAGVGSVAIKPGHVIHRNVFGPEGARILSIELPAWLSAERGLGADRWRWIHRGPLAVLATRVWMLTREGAGAAGLVDAVIELIASANELDGTRGRRSPPDWLRHVQQRLADEADAGHCSLTSLAAEAGVHPVYLARVFRQNFRCSVSQYVQALRLSRAVECMATTTASLASVAAAAGYADQSHLSRSCRRGLGVSPRKCRRLLSASDPQG